MFARKLIAAFLALTLLLTAQAMAQVRGASAASGQMVICTGTGPMVVHVDAEGQPTEAPHLCPEAALHLLIDQAPPFLATCHGLVAVYRPDAQASEPVPAFASELPPARAPPFPV